MEEQADLRLPYGDLPDQFVDVFMPTVEQRGSVVLIHGGYWRDRYALDIMVPLARHLADRGWATLNVEYRRLVDDGEPIWPEMSADVIQAAQLIPARPAIAIGHSAGGHLALWLAGEPSMIDAVVALAPLADLRAADRLDLSDGVVRKLLGGSAADAPSAYDAASPIERLPTGVPQLLVHGDADESVPQQISFDYAAAALAAEEDIRLVTPAGVDHMQVIDPGGDTWRMVDDQLDLWADRLAVHPDS